VALQQDVTERVQLLEELRQHRDELEGLVNQRTAELTLARQQADLANNAKSRFLAAASHDLRQPLAALALYVGVLKRPHGPQTADVVDQIEHCVGQLSELLTDLLDLSKLDAGVVAPKLSDFALADALSPLLSIYGAKARNKGLQLRCRTSIALVRTDVQWLSRLLGNLLDNAVEYTQHGGVLVAFRRHQGRQWLEVWDTGVGIPPDQTSVVFEEFRQLGDQARTHGSGLGLSIVAKTAALLGLRLRLRSRPGRGSMFAIELPPGQLPAPVPETLAPVPLADLTVAVVDDNPQVLAALTAAIDSMGPKVIAASSGVQLMGRLTGQVPHLVVSDYRVADGETGLEVIERLRSTVGCALPGIIVTGDTDPATVRSMSQHGIAVLFKPLQIDGLRVAIQRALADAPPT
jgi:CheY-like chemotaxis protein